MMRIVMRAVLGFCLRERWLVLLATAGIVALGIAAVDRVPLDAIPDVGENQVIVYTTWPGRSPKDIEDQVTYPLSIALQAVPGAESIRGSSLFGFSFVQVTFADDIDFYWARSRVSEQLSTIAGELPADAKPALGPDATGLGQVLYYVLEPPPGMNLAEVRSQQDFTVKYALQSVDGVSEVASIGGYVRQYQIEVDPDKLRYHGLTLDQVIAAVRASNIDVGAKTVESGGMEYVVRGKGFLGADQELAKTIGEIDQTVIRTHDGVPVRVKDIGFVQAGPDFRRGALDLNGSEAVGGVVVMQYGENPRAVIQRVREKIEQLEPTLDGTKFHIVYDRTTLIDETVATLSTALVQEILITIVVIVLFLLHVRASLVVAVTLPIAVLMAFIAMDVFEVDANIMSLAGIAIAIGTMVDMGIVVSENIYRHLAQWEAQDTPGGREQRTEIIHDSASEVVPAVVTAVTTTVVSFLPVFMLTGRDLKLFAPLAWTKTFALVASLIVAVALIPLLCRIFLVSARWTRVNSAIAGSVLGMLVAASAHFGWAATLAEQLAVAPVVATITAAVAGFLLGYFATRETTRPADRNPVARAIYGLYEPILRLLLRHKVSFLTLPATIVVAGVIAYFGIAPLLYPVERVASVVGADLNALPRYTETKDKLTGVKTDDWIALDEGSWFYMPTLYPAASFSQAMEVLQTQDTLISQIPEVENVLGKIGRVESALDPAPAAMIETYVMLKPKSKWREGVTSKDVWNEINAVATLPGVTPASPLYPIEGRVVMLQSGIKASMAVRIFGDTLDELSTAAQTVADQLKSLPEVNPGTVNPDIVLGKPYAEFQVDREQAARYGMSTAKVNQVVEAALGGTNVTTTVEGRHRYDVRVRYQRNWREHIDELGEVPVVTPTGEVVPLANLAQMTTTWGPGSIRSEDARLVAHVSFSPTEDIGDLEAVAAVEAGLRSAEATKAIDLEIVGSFENQIEANRRLMWIVPLVILLNVTIVYLQFRELPITLAVFSGIPVAFAGGMIAVAIAGVEMNTAVWVGFIALFGIAIDDGVVMATYLHQVFSRERPDSIDGVREATIHAGLQRIRPCLMTTFTTMAALVPVLVSSGRGADVARAMAVPIFGGMVVELITLFVVPILYCGYAEWSLRCEAADRELA